jgi:hypothetical protein
MGAIELKTIILIFGIIAGCVFAVCGVWLHKNAMDKSANGEFSGEGGGFKIKLTNYGPGVVIALFGALLVVFCITRTFSQTSNVTESNTTKTVRNGDGNAVELIVSHSTVSSEAANSAITELDDAASNETGE